MTHKINNDRTAAVSDITYYNNMDTCPVGVKVILLNLGNTAVISQWNGKDKWMGWHPLPRSRKETEIEGHPI